MIRKTVLLAGVTAALLTAAPALAQDAVTPPAAEAQVQGALQLQPGANVKGSDGAVLGRLEGVQSNAAGEQELTVRGADGDLRGVPLGGLRQEGADVVVGLSSAEFQTAPVVDDAAPVGQNGDVPAAGDPLSNPAPVPNEPETAPETPPTPQG